MLTGILIILILAGISLAMFPVDPTVRKMIIFEERATMDTAELNATVYDFLHRSRVAASAAVIAREDGNEQRFKELCEKSDRLMGEAETVDPGHECAAWADHLRGTN